MKWIRNWILIGSLAGMSFGLSLPDLFAVDISFRVAESGQSVLSIFGAAPQSSEKQTTLRFADEKIYLKAGTLNMVVDFEAQEIRWTDQKKAYDGTLEFIQDQISFVNFRGRGAESTGYFTTYSPMFEKTKTLKFKRNVLYKEHTFKKWSQEREVALTEMKSQSWTLGEHSELAEIRRYVQRMVDSIGAVPSVPAVETWFRVLLETGELPMVLQETSTMRLPMNIASGHNEGYLILEEINGQPGITAHEVGELVNQKTFLEHFENAVAQLRHNLSSWIPIMMSVCILLLIFSPSWGPWLQDTLISKGGSRGERKIRIREQALRFYNYLNTAKSALNKEEARRKWAAEFLMNGFQENLVYRSHLTRSEKKQFEAIKRLFESTSQDALVPEKAQDCEATLTRLMQRCDKIVEKH